MHVQGYLAEVELDDGRLVVTPANKASAVALLGQDRKDGRLVLPLADLERFDLKAAGRLTNGALTLHTTAGRRYVVHFRLKQAEGFTALAAALPQ